MLTPGKNFRLKNTTKAMMASITDDTARGEFKRAMIQAQLQSEIMPPRDKKPAGGLGNSRGSSRSAPTDAAQ
jgi:hypothetical protein